MRTLIRGKEFIEMKIIRHGRSAAKEKEIQHDKKHAFLKLQIN